MKTFKQFVKEVTVTADAPIPAGTVKQQDIPLIRRKQVENNKEQKKPIKLYL